MPFTPPEQDRAPAFEPPAQDRGQDDESWGRIVAEFIGREVGSVAGTIGGAAFGGGTQLYNAALCTTVRK